jgi:hypothetical protein
MFFQSYGLEIRSSPGSVAIFGILDAIRPGPQVKRDSLLDQIK